MTTKFTLPDIDGFDPLEEREQENPTIHQLLEDSRKRDVLNIIRSYTGTFDCLSEAIQNSLDAVDKKFSTLRGSYIPKIWIYIDTLQSVIKVTDNGIGMSREQFLFCLRPNVSFKDRGIDRGHKGVGATFLAYGFSHFKLQTRKDSEISSAVLFGGRQWAEDISNTIPRPRLEAISFDVPELEGEDSGTSVEIRVGQNERPRLAWLNIESAVQWLDILRLRTPVGGVYLKTPPFSPNYVISSVSLQGTRSNIDKKNISYYFPHEFPNISKSADINSIQEALAKIPGDARTKQTRLPQKFKQLDCLWEIWDTSTILADDSPFRRGEPALDSNQIELVARHKVAVYGCFMKSRRVWNDFQVDYLKVRTNIKIINGGLQLASDRMIQGDPITIPLTSAAGYQTFAHILVHFTDGNPDLGRKVFQPELKGLAELLAVRADTGSRSTGSEKDLYEWKKSQEKIRDERPLLFSYNGQKVCLISQPQEEQDVIALFHELIGIGLLRGIEFFSTSYNEKYDGLFRLNYEKDESLYFDNEKQRLGVSRDTPLPSRSEPKVIEYKYTFDALCRDFANEIKFHKDINLVVCWELGNEFEEQFAIHSLLIEGEGNVREIYGSTHRAFLIGDSQRLFEVVSLKDLLAFMEDPAGEAAHQKSRYGL